MNVLRGFLSLTPADRGTVARTVAILPLVRGALRLRGYATTTSWLARLAHHRALARPEIEARARLAQRVMTRLPLHVTCLERALVVWWLSSHNSSVEIRFGVQPADDGGTPRFHAWVEMDGEPLDDGLEDPSAYLPFAPPELRSQLPRPSD